MAAGLLDLDLFCLFCPFLAGKLRGESLPNFSNIHPEFCPEFRSEFSMNFWGIFRALFPGKRRPLKIHQNSPPFFNAKSPDKFEEKIHKYSLESRQSNGGWGFKWRRGFPIRTCPFFFCLFYPFWVLLGLSPICPGISPICSGVVPICPFPGGGGQKGQTFQRLNSNEPRRRPEIAVPGTFLSAWDCSLEPFLVILIDPPRLKCSSEVEHFKRAAHQRPDLHFFFVGGILKVDEKARPGVLKRPFCVRFGRTTVINRWR